MKNKKYKLHNSGRVVQKSSSVKVQKGINAWRDHVEDTGIENTSRYNYWRVISTCGAL